MLLLGLLFYYYTQSFFSFNSTDSFRFDNEKFSKIGNLVVEQNSIYEMDDCSRDQKYLNDISIRMTENYVSQDTGCCPHFYCCPKYYKNVLDSLKIDEKLFDNLKQQLADSKLYSFCKSKDSVLFIVDGFLGDSWGFMYNPKGLGYDTTKFLFRHYKVKFVDNINKNWKRAAID